MALILQPVRLTTEEPLVFNSKNELTVSLRIRNIGSSDAANVTVTSTTLYPASRSSPPGLPLFVGDIAAGGFRIVSARFNIKRLSIGRVYLFAVAGTYETRGTTHRFSVNRRVTVPRPTGPPLHLLDAHIEVAVASGRWTYTVFNDEQRGSPQFIGAFSLDIVAPVVVSRTPPGWEAETDNASYVLWSAADQTLPYPHQIAPGTSLRGFQIQSSRRSSEATPYALTAWNHQTDSGGLSYFDLVLSPSRFR